MNDAQTAARLVNKLLMEWASERADVTPSCAQDGETRVVARVGQYVILSSPYEFMIQEFDSIETAAAGYTQAVTAAMDHRVIHEATHVQDDTVPIIMIGEPVAAPEMLALLGTLSEGDYTVAAFLGDTSGPGPLL